MATKRANSLENGESSSRDEQDEAKRPKIVDPFCWLCHDKDTNVFCKSCQRSYHINCVGLKLKKLEFQCNVCIREDLAKTSEANWHNKLDVLNAILEHIVKRLFDGDEFIVLSYNYFESKLPANSQHVNAFDLRYVRTKVQENKYETPLQFLNDIRWIKHNIIASGNTSELKVANRLEQFCKKEIYDIEMCVDCFERSNNPKQVEWFTQVCDPPHIVVWAREISHRPFKPAKVIGVSSKSNKKIDVRFFGDHVMAEVSPNDCYLYSKVNPNTKSDEKTTLALMKNLTEVNNYIDNIQYKYKCSVVKAEAKIPFDVTKISEYLTNMVPNLKLPVDYHLKMKPNYLNPPQRSRGTSVRKQLKVSGSRNGLSEVFVVLENCDHLVELYTRRTNDGMESADEQVSEAEERNEATDQNPEDNAPAFNHGTLDLDSNDDILVISSDDEDIITTDTDTNVPLSDSEEYKPLVEQNEEQTQNPLLELNIEPVNLSEEMSRQTEDLNDDMVTATSYNEIDSFAVNGNADELIEVVVTSENTADDSFSENLSGLIPDISETEDVHETTQDLNESSEVPINSTLPLTNEYAPISDEQATALIATRSSSLVEDGIVRNEAVVVAGNENLIDVEEVIGQSPEHIAEEEPATSSTQKDAIDEMNHDHSYVQKSQEQIQSDNDAYQTNHNSEDMQVEVQLDATAQLLPACGKKVWPLIPTAQSTPLKSTDPPQPNAPIDQSVSLAPMQIEQGEIVKHNEDSIVSLQAELQKKTEAFEKQTEEATKKIESQEATIKSLEAKIVQLTNSLHAKQDELQQLKMDHASELLRVIHETRKKLWCQACGNEVINPFFGISVCSQECLQVLWLSKERENSVPSSADSGIQSSVNEAHNNDVRSLVADLSNDASTNEKSVTSRSNLNVSEPEEQNDSLDGDLRDF